MSNESLWPDPDFKVLVASCDMAVLRALELIGKRVARSGRARHGAMQKSGKPWHEAHVIWRPEVAQVNAALVGAWSILPRLVDNHGCCNLAERKLHDVLDAYVRELAYAQKPHELADLERRLQNAIG